VAIKTGILKNTLIVYCPVIVLEGKLFEYTLNESQEPKLAEANYLKYQVDFHDSREPNPETYLIDVVTLQNLPEYASWLEDEMAKAAIKT
jgi:hypothetical protein